MNLSSVLEEHINIEVVNKIVIPYLDLSDFDYGRYGFDRINKGSSKDYFIGLCNGGHTDIVRNLIEQKVNYYPYEGYKEACAKGHLDIVKLILEHYSFEYEEGLRIACIDGCFDVAKYLKNKLVKQFSNPDLCKEDRKRYEREKIARLNIYFQIACEQGHIRIAHMLLKEGVNGFNFVFYQVCQKGKLSVVKFFLQKRLNSDIYGGFLNACSGGQLEVAKFLLGRLKSKVDWNIAFFNSCTGGNTELVKFIVENHVENSFVENPLLNFNEGLNRACCVGKIELVMFIVETAEKNNYLLNWNEAIYYAFWSCDLKVINVVIPKVKDPNWNRCLGRACEREYLTGCKDVCKLAIKKGATRCEYCGKVSERH